MARVLWLASVLRSAGLTVHEIPGWRTRGADTFGPVRGITCHATAGSRSSSDAGEINVILTGSESAPPPIAQLYLGRNGHWHVTASGRCNHNLPGWAGPNKGLGNGDLLGIEAANNNRDEPWPDVQYRSYVRGVAALVKHLGIGVNRVAGHKEHQPYPPPAWTRSSKSDPTFDMDRFRRDVAAALAGEDDEMELSDKVYDAAAGPRTVQAVLQAGDTRGLKVYNDVGGLVTALAAVRADLATALGRDPVDEEALAQMLWAKLAAQDVDVIERVLREGMGEDALTELAERLAGPSPS